MSFRKDDRVAHTRFGPGVVVDADARYTIIEFDEAGVRKFVTDLVRLERSELPVPIKPAPVKRRAARRRAATEPQSGADVRQPDTTRSFQPDPAQPAQPTKL